MTTRERLAACFMSVVVLSSYTALLWPSDVLRLCGFVALLGFVSATWPRVASQARVFIVLAVAATAAAFGLTDAGPAVLSDAARQSAQFATLLAALATLRLPMRRSALIGRASAWLVSCRPRRRYAALGFGSHLLALIFNFGVVPMMGEMLQRAGLDVRHSPAARHMLVAVMRGMALTTAWSPMAISFAIVSTALPHMNPLAFMAAGFLGAMLMLAGGSLLHRPDAGQLMPRDDAPAGDAGSLLVIMAMAAMLFGVTLLLYRASGLPFIMASAITLPCFSLVWLAAERTRLAPADGAAPAGLPTQFFRVLTEMRSETFIFAGSTFVGQAIVAIVLARAGSLLPGVSIAPWLFALACVWLVPAIAMLSVAPTIVVLLLAQAVLHSGVGEATPVAFACALTLGWSIAINVSPVSATLLIAGSITGVPPRVIAYGWNLRYTLVCAGVAGVFVMALVALGW